MTLKMRAISPFKFEGNKKVICLLIHGFTSSPSDMRLLGEYLKEEGYGVSCPLLPGHGTIPEEMINTTWNDWYKAVEDEYLNLRKKYQDYSIVPIGLSMGGLLALHLAANHNVDALVTICAAIYPRRKLLYFTPLLRHFIDYDVKRKKSEQLEKENDRYIDKEETGYFAYDKIPVKAAHSLLSLMRIVRKEIHNVDSPILILQARNDKSVEPESADYIYENVQSRDKKLFWLEKSGHVATLGVEREMVFQLVVEFAEKIFA